MESPGAVVSTKRRGKNKKKNGKREGKRKEETEKVALHGRRWILLATVCLTRAGCGGHRHALLLLLLLCCLAALCCQRWRKDGGKERKKGEMDLDEERE